MLCRADLINQVSSRLQVHRHTVGDIGDLTERTDQQRVGNLNRAALPARFVGEFIIEAVLAADEWCAEGRGDVVTSDRGPHQCAERFGPVAITPAEVIENGDSPRIGSDRYTV